MSFKKILSRAQAGLLFGVAEPLFGRFDSLRPSRQQFFSYVGKSHPGLNQY